MKKIIMSCGLAAAFILSPILATAEESSNYYLLKGKINQYASWAKVAVLMDVIAAQAQVFPGATASGDKKADSRKICFRLGSVLTSIIGSAARYGSHAKDPLEKDEARQTMILGLSATTYCGFNAQDV